MRIVSIGAGAPMMNESGNVGVELVPRGVYTIPRDSFSRKVPIDRINKILLESRNVLEVKKQPMEC